MAMETKHQINELEGDSPARSRHWEKHFPLRRQDEARVTRRQFTNFMCMASVTSAFGLWAAKNDHAATAEPLEDFAVCSLNDFVEGESRIFEHPRTGQPILMIRFSEDEFAAYDQRCTHLLCPVHYEEAKQEIICPCHHGVFDARDGRPLAGPPRIPLHRYQVDVRAGVLYLSQTPGNPPNPLKGEHAR